MNQGFTLASRGSSDQDQYGRSPRVVYQDDHSIYGCVKCGSPTLFGRVEAILNCPEFCGRRRFRFLLPFEIDGREHPVPDVLALRIVAHLDMFERVLPRFIPVSVGFTSYPLSLEQVEEALRHRIVAAVSTPAHRVLKVVVPEERCPLHAGKLRALIGVNQDLGLWLPSDRFPYRRAAQPD